MGLLELLVIVLAAGAGCVLAWSETGRDPLLMRAGGVVLGAFLLGGAVATVAF
jgi:hypothetical protein